MASVMPTSAPAAMAPAQQAEAEGVAGAFARQAGRLARDETGGERDKDKDALPETGVFALLPPALPPLGLPAHGRRAADAQPVAAGMKAASGAVEKEARRDGGRASLEQALAAAAKAAAHAGAAAPQPGLKPRGKEASGPAAHGEGGLKEKAQPALPAAPLAEPWRLGPLSHEHLRAALPAAAGMPPSPPQSPLSDLPAVPSLGRLKDEPHKPVAAEASAQPASLPAAPRKEAEAGLPPRAETPRPQTPGMERQPPQPAAAGEPQAGLTYRFQRWGGEHSVNVQLPSGPGAAQLTLQPSDSLVQQRLSEQWQHGDPQRWELARDGGERQRRDGRQPEPEEDA
ncbi:type III secretion system needle length determinant, SpaN/EivJ family [Chromobacterium subtsugae]|uniref:SpaN/EivJ family type III secretion system needle length determinant n=1 Tax=Chromobacterium subtsugae TaxID=251747 RepID=UPI0007F877A3|nr:type III secretion system needle length determinant, SpaN/EivJ family [Chromobacterium subtsugae]OBU86806.1 hypothetical protein MY55_08305 [Chromobacterium subtsugae]